MDEAVKRNMALFTEAMKMWPGFSAVARQPAPAETETPPAAADPLNEMRRQMDEMRAQLDKLSKG